MKQSLVLLGLLAGAMLLGACTEPNTAEYRNAFARDHAGDIRLGVVWPLSSAKGTLKNGVEMALAEINEAGGVLGRKLDVVMRDDERSVNKGMLLAQEFAQDPQVVAVVGHLDSYIAIPVASSYEFSGILMVSPGSTGMRLTQQGFGRIFRTMVNNRESSTQLAEYAAKKQYRRIVIYYINNDYGRDLANFFEQRANDLNLTIVDRRAYEKVGGNHARVLAEWKHFHRFDAVFLAGSLPEGADIIREARELGIDAAILGGIGLDAPDLIATAGEYAEGVVVTSVFHPDIPRPEVLRFTQAYEQRLGVKPDASAAQGYDTVRLLADAIRRAGSAEPDKIAAALHATRQWKGVTGTHSFDEHGELSEKRIVLNVVRDGRFEYLE